MNISSNMNLNRAFMNKNINAINVILEKSYFIAYVILES